MHLAGAGCTFFVVLSPMILQLRQSMAHVQQKRTSIRCEDRVTLHPPLAERGIDIMEGSRQEAWLSSDRRKARRAALGLEDTRTLRFVQQTEFISLGCYCAASKGLQALGLKRYSYPLDWVRSPIEGIIRLLDTNFADFLTCSCVRDEGVKGHLMGCSKWGGSFWHHDILQPKVRDDFLRRIDRFFGRKEIPATTTRVFVRAVNSTQELSKIPELHSALKRTFPSAKIFLLVLVDNQKTAGPLRVADASCEEIVFCRIHESVLNDNWTMEKQSDAYADAIAVATRCWAGSRSTWAKIEELPSLSHLSSMMTAIDAGDPACRLFYPFRVEDAPAAAPRATAPDESRHDPLSKSHAASVAQSRNASPETLNRTVHVTRPSIGAVGSHAPVLGLHPFIGAGMLDTRPLSVEAVARAAQVLRVQSPDGRHAGSPAPSACGTEASYSYVAAPAMTPPAPTMTPPVTAPSSPICGGRALPRCSLLPEPLSARGCGQLGLAQSSRSPPTGFSKSCTVGTRRPSFVADGMPTTPSYCGSAPSYAGSCAASCAGSYVGSCAGSVSSSPPRQRPHNFVTSPYWGVVQPSRSDRPNQLTSKPSWVSFQDAKAISDKGQPSYVPPGGVDASRRTLFGFTPFICDALQGARAPHVVGQHMLAGVVNAPPCTPRTPLHRNTLNPSHQKRGARQWN